MARPSPSPFSLTLVTPTEPPHPTSCLQPPREGSSSTHLVYVLQLVNDLANDRLGTLGLRLMLPQLRSASIPGGWVAVSAEGRPERSGHKDTTVFHSALARTCCQGLPKLALEQSQLASFNLDSVADLHGVKLDLF